MSPTYRIAGKQEPDCTECGEVGKVHGDPRRGFCLLHRHMIGGLGTCNDFTRVPWIDRMPPLSTTNR